MKKLEKAVADEKVFHLYGGKTLKSLKDLYDEIHHMHEDVFNHHVSKDHNHFSNWVKDVIGDKALAAKISKAVTLTMLKDVLKGEFNPKPAAGKTVVKKEVVSKVKTAVKAATVAKTAKSTTKAAAAKTIKAKAPKAKAAPRKTK